MIKNSLHILIKIFALISLSFSYAALAKKNNDSRLFRNDTFLRESNKCAVYTNKLERRYKIPKNLLYSVTIQESGRYHKPSRKTVPWPWTVNMQGKGYYFKTKREAVQFVKQNMKKGIKSIDVGCAQINMRYHGNNFKSIFEAFDPWSNVKYAAQLLRSKYDKTKNWEKAVSYYHSGDPIKGQKYHASVAKIASNINGHKFQHRRSYKPLNKNLAAKNTGKISSNGKKPNSVLID